MRVNRDADVIVVGGGTAGAIAAIAAARNGARTLLIDKHGFLGGTATAGNVFHGFFDCRGNQVVKGIGEELVQRMIAEEGSPGHLLGGKWGHGVPEYFVYSQTPYDLETFKYVIMRMVDEAGARMLLHTFFASALCTDQAVTGVEVHNKSGRSAWKAKVVVDCSGDADVAASAGASYEFGRGDGKAQNVTLLFTLGGVDFDRVVEYSRAHVRVRTWGEWHSRLMKAPKLGESQPSYVSMSGKIIIDDDLEKGTELSCGFRSLRPGELRLNVTRTIGIDGTKAEDLTRAEIEERKKVFEVAKALRRLVPGFERSFLAGTATEVGVRESRRIIGDYVLSTEDVLEGRDFEDSVCRGAYPVDIHDPEGGHVTHTFVKDGLSYGIPYRCFLPRGLENILVGGRCISTSHVAHGSTRQMPTCVAMGQAVGTAAALAVKKRTTLRALDVELLRSTLVKQGACV